MKSGISVTVARHAAGVKDWFDPRVPLKLLNYFPRGKAIKFRKKYIRGFVKIGGCNHYVALLHDGKIIGVLGFSNPDFGKYDILLKADTTPSSYEKSIDLLLYVLRTKEVKKILEQKFNREINSIYCVAFTKNKEVNRYRKHGKKVMNKEMGNGFKVGYVFNAGSVPTLKAAKAEFMNKNKWTQK